MNSFKIYMHDIGLLVCLNEYGVANTILNDNFYANNGGIIECLFAICLKNNGIDLFYFQKKSGMEIDFIINLGGICTAIEVKSGNNKQAKSLNSIIQNYKSVKRYLKFENTPEYYKDDKNVEHLPLFFISFIENRGSLIFL